MNAKELARKQRLVERLTYERERQGREYIRRQKEGASEEELKRLAVSLGHKDIRIIEARKGLA